MMHYYLALDFTGLVEGFFVWFREFLKILVDTLAAILPSTPDQLKFYALISGYFQADSFADYFVWSIIQSIIQISSIYLISRVVRFLPFF